MMGLREFVELFDKNEVKNLFNALSSCIEYVRIDLHVFNIGAHVACLYSNDPELLSQAEGCNVDGRVSCSERKTNSDDPANRERRVVRIPPARRSLRAA